MIKKLASVLNPKNILSFVFEEERRGSVLIIFAALIALAFSNSRWSSVYFDFFSYKLSLGIVNQSVKDWINEGLMSLFFLAMGIEVKRELIEGELRTWKKAAFPLFAALGGMLIPALLFSIFNPYPPMNRGWAVPMATDIAIALGVLGLFGKQFPKSLRVFLLSLAIIDDIGSIAVIGIFYSQPDNTFALLITFILVGVLFLSRKWQYWPAAFLLIGLSIWYCILLAGISGTMAGVTIAFLLPAGKGFDNGKNWYVTENIEGFLIPVTSLIIVPVFAFANAGFRFADFSLARDGGFTIFIGVFAGLLVGKPLGIILAGWLANSLRIAAKPENITWNQLTGVGFVAGIGFTVSLLIADLSYAGQPVFENAIKLGVFSASVIAAIVGLGLLTLFSGKTYFD